MKKIYKVSAICLAWCVSILFQAGYAQMSLNWEAQGPDNLGSRTRAITFNADGSKVFAGAVGGGLWETTTLGDSWTRVTGFNQNQVVSTIAMKNNKIYVGTGELIFYSRMTNPGTVYTVKNGYLGYSGLMGEGVYVSLDGGLTFSNANSTWPHGSTPTFNSAWTSVQKLAVNPQTTRVFAATLRGLYYTEDDFANVSQPTGAPELSTQAFLDVAVMADGLTVLAATATKLFISTDGGNSFAAISDATVTGGSDPLGGTRIVIAPSPTDGNVVYVSGTFPLTNNVKGGRITGVFKSSDKGVSWSRIAPSETYADEQNMGWFAPHSIASNKLRGQGTYAFMLAVDPSNPDRIFLGGQQFFIYTPASGWVLRGNPSNSPFNSLYMPANIHTVAFHPTNPRVMFFGTDKELIRSLNGATALEKRTMGYKAALLFGASAAPDGSVVAGSQTHGIIHKNTPVASDVQSFTIGANGVGGKVVASIIPAKEDYAARRFDDFLGSLPQGLLNRSSSKGATYELFYALPETPNPFGSAAGDTVIDRPFQIPLGSTAGDNALGRPNDFSAYISTFLLDEFLEYGNPQAGESNHSIAYLATNRYIWTILRPFATPSSQNSEVPTWTRISPPLLTQGGAGSEIGTDPEKNPQNGISAMGVSNDINHTLFVGTTNGKVFRILRPHEPTLMDTSTMFSEITAMNLPNRWITSIAVNPQDPNQIVLTFGGYAAGDSRVFRSNDALSTMPTFTEIQGNLPPIPVYTCAYNPNSPAAGFILGTEWGIFTTTDDIHNTTSPNWVETNDGEMVRVPVFDIKSKRFDAFYMHDPTLYIATHGRGVYKSSALVSTEKAVNPADLYQVKVYPNPLQGNGTFEYTVPGQADVKVELFDITGSRIQLINETGKFSGHTTGVLPTANVNNGIYMVKFSFTENGKEITKTVKVAVMH